MLIVYDAQSLSIISISAVHPQNGLLNERELKPKLSEPLPKGQDTLYVSEPATIESVLSSLEVGAKITIDADLNVIADTPVDAYVNPKNPCSGEIVNVNALLPADSKDAEITFLLEGGQAYTEPQTNGHAEHDFKFLNPGVYYVAASSVSHGVKRVEVVVT